MYYHKLFSNKCKHCPVMFILRYFNNETWIINLLLFKPSKETSLLDEICSTLRFSHGDHFISTFMISLHNLCLINYLGIYFIHLWWKLFLCSDVTIIIGIKLLRQGNKVEYGAYIFLSMLFVGTDGLRNLYHNEYSSSINTILFMES